MLQFQSKLPNVGTTIFTTMSALANQHNAINLSQGFPNFKSDKQLTHLVSKAMEAGYNQYAPMAGVLALREAISEKIEGLYRATYHPETEVTITAGATQAIYTIVSAFIQPNDEVIVFTPAYDCYEPAVEVNGGKTIAIELQGADFAIDWNEVRTQFSEKTKMIIINTPHNPSGTIWSNDDMLQLQALVKGTNCIVLSDEVYEHLVFDGQQHQSAALYPELFDRTFICASFGKTFHNTGWKIGYCVAPKPLMDEFRKVHQFNVFCVNHPVQHALATYLKTPEHYLGLSAFFQQKRDLFLEAIKDSRFKSVPSQGTYFQVLAYDGITDELDVDFAKRLTIEHKIASIPLSVFYKKPQDLKLLRFCFAKTDETLLEAAAILNTI